MSNYIIKIQDKYFEWSTGHRMPTCAGMTRDELHLYLLNKYGQNEIDKLPVRLQRVAKTGTSSRNGYTLDQVIQNNRAGFKHTCLTKEEIYREYS